MNHTELNMPANEQNSMMYLLTALWAIAIAIGFFSMVKYENTASNVYHHPQTLPETFSSQDSCNVLIMALHPHCPCSRASLGELQRLQGKTGNAARLIVLVYVPEEQNQVWAEGLSIAQLNRLDAEILYDSGGLVCRELGLNTSGETLFYNTRGKLLFSGGITASRGHAGANYGITYIQNALIHQTVDPSETPVFGCSISSAKIGEDCHDE